ncbi:MAG: type 1 glutamine amidotransferase [Candidatus Aminicenantes bacterium]|nr:type 1 glutamine amidotransferase [Candidatus Aminicenantes bacterium]
MASEPKVALIDNSLYPDLYKPVDHWRKYLAVPFQVFRAKEVQFPELSDGFTHIILTGSEASILERDEWVRQEVEFIRLAFNRGLALLGSCYGHQLLALSLLGEAHVRRCLQPEIGWIKIKALRPHEFFGHKKQFYAFSIHFDEVVDLKPPFYSLAETEICSIQAMEMKGERVWGIQFHPEINLVEARFLLQELVKRGWPHQDLFIQALKMEPRDSGVINSIITSFLKS